MPEAPLNTVPPPGEGGGGRSAGSPLKRVLMTVLKVVIAVAGIWYVAHSVRWYDTAVVPQGTTIRTLKLAHDTEVRVLHEAALAAGTTMAAPATQEEPRITYTVEFPATMEVDAENARGATVRITIDDHNREAYNLPRMLVLPAETLKRDEHEVVKGGLKSTLVAASSRWYLLLAAWGILGIPFLVTAVRWRALMRPQGIEMPLSKSIQLTFVGQFYSILLPGITGGDLVKIVYAARLTGSKTKSIITVMLDRVVGLVALMVIGALSAAWQLYENSQAANTGGAGGGNDATLRNVLILIAAGLGAMALFCIVYFSRRLRGATGLQRLIDSPRMPYFVKHSDEVLHRYRGHFGLLLWAFVISLFSQLTLPVSAWLSGMALGIHMNVGYYLAYVPVAILAASLPISLPQGIGFLEWVLNHFFVARGAATSSQALALTQAIRFLPILWNLVGAFWVVTGRFSRQRAMAEEKAPGEAT